MTRHLASSPMRPANVFATLPYNTANNRMVAIHLPNLPPCRHRPSLAQHDSANHCRRPGREGNGDYPVFDYLPRRRNIWVCFGWKLFEDGYPLCRRQRGVVRHGSSPIERMCSISRVELMRRMRVCWLICVCIGNMSLGRS